MNILLIDNSIGRTGALNAILETIEPLRGEYTFFFAVPEGGTAASILREEGYIVYELPFIEISRNMRNNLRYPFRLIANARRIKKLIRQHEIHLLQVNDLYNLAGIVAKRFVDVKVITHIRRMPESFPLKLYHFWVRIHKKRSDKILPVSEANNRVFADCGKSEVFYDPAPQTPVTFTYNAKEKHPAKLLYLANFTIGKGQNHALDALKTLHERRPDLAVHLHFEGSDFGLEKNREFREHLKQTAADYGLSAMVSFGSGTASVAKPISEAHIMLNFSDSESLSRVTMEALHFGIPVIATNVGGTAEMIKNGWNGLLVERANVAQMADAMEQLLDSETMREDFSENGKAHLQQHFSQEKLTLQLSAIYQSLV